MIDSAIYDRFVRPVVRNMVTPESANLLSESHPLRIQCIAFSDMNPFMPMLDGLAEKATQERKPASKENPFLSDEAIFGEIIETQLNMYRTMRDTLTETMFFSIYTSPIVKSLIAPLQSDAPKHRVVDVRQMPEVHSVIAKIEHGGVAEAVVRFAFVK